MSRIPSRTVTRLCMVLTMLLLATGCDLSGLFGGNADPPAAEAPAAPAPDDSDGDDAPEPEAPEEEPPSDEPSTGHSEHDHDTGTGDAEEEGFGNDVDPDMPEINADMLLDGSAGSGDLRIRESGDPIPSEEGPFPGQGTFRVFCQVSHMNFDDPIVFPGEAGASHAHQFLGNTGTEADSTAESIASSGNSTCTGGIADRSAYWMPVIVDTAADEVVPSSFNAVYYQSGFGGVDAGSIQPIPEGLMMIAGDPTRTPSESGGGQFGFSNARWGCFNGGGAPETQGDGTTIPDCSSDQSVTAIINFPQCWDGENLDSEDHRSHMAYPSGGQCPDSHPVAIPAIMQMWIFPVDGGDTADWRLASDMYPADQAGGASLHADFVNGWDPEIMERWVDACIRPELDCERSELGGGESLS